MASAADYVFNRAPTAADFPQFNGNWIGNLPNDYWQGQQYGYNRNLQTLFQPGQPGADQLQGMPPLMQTIARAGGVPALGPLFPAMVQAQAGASLASGVNGGGNYQAAQGGGVDPRGKIPVARAAAEKYGVDPNRFVAMLRAEGLGDFNGDYENGKPTSFGAPQLHKGGRTRGLGDEFYEETGLDPADPRNEDAVIDWSAKNLSRTGWKPYNGATKIGLRGFEGISRNGTPQEANAGVSQPATGAPAPVEQPTGATGTAPFMAASSQQGAGPANIGGMRTANASEVNPDTNQTIKAVSTTEASQGSPERIARAAGNTDTSTPGPAASSPPPPGTASANAPQNRATPQGPSTTTGQEAGRALIRRPGDSEQALRTLEARINQARARLGEPDVAFANKDQVERLKDRIGTWQTEHDQMLERMNKENELTAGVQIKGEEDIQAAIGKRVAEAIGGGGQAARHTVNTLDLMSDAIDRAGPNISFGPGSPELLKIKQWANNISPGLFEGVPEAETIQKLNAFLAAEAAKSMTARPSQLEFKAFMANNPGLQTSLQGTKVLINILRQGKMQDINLAQEAMNVRNPRDWPAIEKRFYERPENQIVSPVTGRPLNGKDRVQGAQAAPLPIPNAQHIQHLRANPGDRGEFDRKFGAGAAARVLEGL